MKANRRLRVIAGDVGGRRLEAPAGDRTRPTTDRVKESLFSHLGTAVDGASVLDGYAGSGALAIEALSRGAKRVVLVDRAKSARSVICRNLTAMGMTDRATVIGATLEGALAAEPPSEAPFDLVFVDPPYDEPTSALERVLELLAGREWTGGHARIVTERPIDAGAASPPTDWDTTWSRATGGTLVSVLTRLAP